jgi:hypothetical protein
MKLISGWAFFCNKTMGSKTKEGKYREKIKKKRDI